MKEVDTTRQKVRPRNSSISVDYCECCAQVPVAVKTLNQSHLVNGKDAFLGEAKVMVQLDHPCIVKLIGICQQQELMLVNFSISLCA